MFLNLDFPSILVQFVLSHFKQDKFRVATSCSPPDLLVVVVEDVLADGAGDSGLEGLADSAETEVVGGIA